MARLVHLFQWFGRHPWWWWAFILSCSAVFMASAFWPPAIYFILALLMIFLAWFWYSFLRAWWLWEKKAYRTARGLGAASSPPMRRLLRWVFNGAAAAWAVPMVTRVQQWRSIGTEAIAAVFLSRDVPFWQRFGPMIMAFTFFVMGVKNVAGLPWWYFVSLAIIGLVFYPFELRTFIHKRSKERLDAGLCPACGYDLRATSERCPECGTVPKKMSRADSPCWIEPSAPSQHR
jgi:hypothetical protein